MYDKKVHGKRYTVAQKLAVKALLDSGMTPTEIQQSEKMDRTTVYNVMRDKRVTILAQDQVNKIKDSLVGMTYGNAYRAQEKITDNKLEEMNAYQLTMISAVNVDKARLMTNLSTENVSHRSVIEHIDTEVNMLREKMDELRK